MRKREEETTPLALMLQEGTVIEALDDHDRWFQGFVLSRRGNIIDVEFPVSSSLPAVLHEFDLVLDSEFIRLPSSASLHHTVPTLSTEFPPISSFVSVSSTSSLSSTFHQALRSISDLALGDAIDVQDEAEFWFPATVTSIAGKLVTAAIELEGTAAPISHTFNLNTEASKIRFSVIHHLQTQTKQQQQQIVLTHQKPPLSDSSALSDSSTFLAPVSELLLPSVPSSLL